MSERTASENSYDDSEFVLRRIPHATVKDDSLEYVQPDDKVSVAISRMVACEYSQMPVHVESRHQSDGSVRQLYGVVTWQSITRALLSDVGGRLPVCKDACDPPERFQRFSADTSVVDVVGPLFDHDFILTYDNDGSLFGIMTSADLVRWAGEHAMGLVEVRRLELRLRELCKAFAQNKGRPPEKMKFSYYEKKLVNDEQAWDRMVKSGPWQGVSRQEFRSLFKEAAKARHAIFHFMCEDQPEEYLEHRKKLTQLVRLLEFAGPEPPNSRID